MGKNHVEKDDARKPATSAQTLGDAHAQVIATGNAKIRLIKGSFLGDTGPNFMHSVWFRGCHGRGRNGRIEGWVSVQTACGFPLSAERLGLHGSSVCTLGPQVFGITDRSFGALLKGVWRQAEPLLPADRARLYFADDVLLPLGYHVDSMDASDYEGANIVHDLNLPIPPALRERYDLVWDGGTLEHIFNFPVAIFNAMHMVKVGGHLLLETPTNNQCGHGSTNSVRSYFSGC